MYISSKYLRNRQQILVQTACLLFISSFFIIFTIDKSLAKWFTLWIQVDGDPGSLQFTDKSFTHTDFVAVVFNDIAGSIL